MRFGGTTITFVSVTEDPDNRGAYNKPAEVRTETVVPGCHARPYKSDEKTTEVGTIVTEQLKITAPPVAAVLSAKSSDEIRVDGVVYQIVGAVRPYEDLRGRVIKVTVVAQRITP